MKRPVALALLCLACLGHCLLYSNNLIDDAYVTYRYARSLVEGQGLVFNPGERVEGFTSPLWTLVTAGVIAAGVADPHVYAQWLGVILSCATAVVLFLLGERILGPHGAGWRWLAPLLLVSRASFAYYACSGMETALYVFVVTLGLYRLWCEGLSPQVGCIMGLGALTRPEAPYVFLLFVALAWVRHRTGGPALSRRGLVGAAAAFVALPGAWLAFRIGYYGELLPNTYYAKVAPMSVAWPAGWIYAKEYLAHVFGAPLVAIAFVLVRRGASRLALAGLWTLGILPIFQLGGDWMYLFRFFEHALPFEALLIAVGIRSAAEILQAVLRPQLVGAALLVLSIGLGVDRTLPAIRTVDRYYPEFYRRAGVIADWIGSQAEIRRIALVDVGLIGYRSRKEVIDLGGLTDKVIARAPGMHLLKEYDPGYVLGREPEMVVFRTLGPGAVRSARGIELTPGSITGVDRRLYEYRPFHERYVYLCSAALGVEPADEGAPGARETRDQILYAYHVYGRKGVPVSRCPS